MLNELENPSSCPTPLPLESPSKSSLSSPVQRNCPHTPKLRLLSPYFRVTPPPGASILTFTPSLTSAPSLTSCASALPAPRRSPITTAASQDPLVFFMSSPSTRCSWWLSPRPAPAPPGESRPPSACPQIPAR